MNKTAFIPGILLLILTGCQRYEHPSTWSIVAADPRTGEVGVAAASCVPQSIDALASLVPGKGAAASQAAFAIENRNKVFDLLQQGESADKIIEAVTSVDPDSASRQYGIITVQGDTIVLDGFTGSDNGAWAGDQQTDLIFPVTVQGNVLAGEAVVREALAAFNDPSIGDVLLADRLMRALESGSAAGGDKRCNVIVRQTAAAAFIMVADGDEAPFAAAGFGNAASDSVLSPSLHLSVSGWIGSVNPIIELRSEYDQWRQANAETCDKCNLEAISVPSGGSGLTGVLGTILFIFPIWLLLVLAAVFVGVVLLIKRWRGRRKSNRAT